MRRLHPPMLNLLQRSLQCCRCWPRLHGLSDVTGMDCNSTLGSILSAGPSQQEPIAATLQARQLDISILFEPVTRARQPCNHRTQQLPQSATNQL